MKIGIVVPGFSADERDWCIPALRNFVAVLAATDDVVVVALRYPHRAARYSAFGARVIALGGARRRGVGSATLWRATLAAIRDEHRRSPFDLLHAFWASETGALTAVSGRLLHIPAIVSLAGGELIGLRDINYGDQLAAAQRLKVRVALRLADHVTGGSGYILDLATPYLRHRPSRSIHRLPLGVDTARFSLAPQPPCPSTRALRLVTAASLVPVKDQAMLLRALADLRGQGHAATLAIAGNGSADGHLRDLTASLGLADSVAFLGPVAHDALPDLYHRSDIFVLTSRHEAQGMAPLEAAACGLPIAGTAVGILPELAPAVLTVPVGDQAAFAAALAALAAGPTRLAAMREAARSAVTGRFDLAHTVRQFRSLYRDATSP